MSSEGGTATDDRPALGVLFVHGIGNQKRGDTLVQFGESLSRFLGRWVTSAQEEDAVSEAAIADPSHPPYAVFAMRGHPGSLYDPADPRPLDDYAAMFDRAESDEADPDAHDVRWMVAESWWSESFTSPTYADLATWGFQVLPWVVATHFGTRARRAAARAADAHGWRRALRIPRVALEFVALCLALAIAVPIVSTLVLLVLLLGLVPIVRVRGAARRLQRLMSSTLGDSYTLLAHPIQAAGILGRVRSDLEWLAARCDRVAVVAHSQGAAVAHQVLYDDPPANVDRLITFGSGLNKLKAIEGARRRLRAHQTALWSPTDPWFAPVGAVLLTWAGWLWRAEIRRASTEDDAWFLPLFVTIFGLMLFAVAVVAAWRRAQPVAASIALNPRVEWLDLHASADPIPNGPLLDPGPPNAEPDDDAEDRIGPRSVTVVNLASVIRDHTSYWRADDDFVATVALELGRSTPDLGLDRGRPLDSARLMVARRRRAWRVSWLKLLRVLGVAAVVAPPLLAPDEVRRLTTPSDGALRWIIERIPLVDAIDPDDATLRVLVGTAYLAAIVTAVYLVAGTAWKWWEHTEIQRLHLRQAPLALSPPFVTFLTIMAIGVEASVILVTGAGDEIPGALAASGLLVLTAVIASLIPIGVVQSALEAMQNRAWLGPPSHAKYAWWRAALVVFAVAAFPLIAAAEAAGRSAGFIFAVAAAMLAVILGAVLVWHAPRVARWRDRLRPSTAAGPTVLAAERCCVPTDLPALHRAAAHEVALDVARLGVVRGYVGLEPALALGADLAEPDQDATSPASNTLRRLVEHLDAGRHVEIAHEIAHRVGDDDPELAERVLRLSSPYSADAAIALASLHPDDTELLRRQLEGYAGRGHRRDRRRAAEALAAV